MKMDVAVIGSGTMGNGIAHVFAVAGFQVTLVDVNEEILNKALSTIFEKMKRQAAKGLLTAQEAEESFKRIHRGIQVEDARNAGIVIEAVPERLELKHEIFSRLDKACPPATILATNTSSIPIASLAAATKRPAKVIGMHFMNPVPVMKLVEIIRGLETSEETYQTVQDLTLTLGKVPVCSKDSPGFISNRVLMPMINEAAWALREGVAKKEDIDRVMELGMNHPMGPLKLADYIGLDTCLSILQVLESGFHNAKYAPCPIFQELIQAGRLGRKVGKGFYDYDER